MTPADWLIRGTALFPPLRLALAEAAQAANEAIRRHDADPAAAEIFSQALAAAAAATVLLGDDEKYSIRWRWAGAVGQVLVEAASDGSIRGMIAEPHPASGGAATLDDLLGTGPVAVAVTRSGQNGRILQSGEVESTLREPAEALAYYFSVSDQIETEIAAALEWSSDPEQPVASAGAALLQALPGCDLEEFARLRTRLESPEARFWLGRAASPGEKLKRVADAVFEGEAAVPEIKTYPAPAPAWRCDCSKERFAAGLKLLSERELDEIFKDGEAATRCRFCGGGYRFDRNEV